MDKVSLTIDGLPITVDKGKTVLEAALENGIYIPHLCFHPDLSSVGACRLCMVDIKGRRPTVACKTPVEPGMVVTTDNAELRLIRQVAAELLIANHDADCLACPKDSNCKLQEVAHYVGVTEERLARLRRGNRSRPLDTSNPFFVRNPNRCIYCGICIRTCEEINGVAAIDFAFRGYDLAISTFGDKPIRESSCESCGECVVRCPTGALVPIHTQKPAREVKTVCNYCGVGCSLFLGVRGNEIVNVDGDPNAPANHGRLCVKGRYGWEFVGHPERLKKPLVRKDGELMEVEWDEALDLVAAKFAEIKARYGGQSMAVLASAKCTNEENYVIQKFARAVLGTNNVDHCARLCHSSSVSGLGVAFGSGAMTNSFDDIVENAQAYFIIGSNTTENHPVLGMRIRQAVRQRGVPLIVCDPRLIPIADLATLHIRQRPGTDIALLNGIMHVLIAEDLYDHDFVANRTEGFDALKACVAAYPPERAADICGVDADDIRSAARLLAAHRPAALLYAMGITQHSTGHDNVLSCANLQMLLGNMGVPGGGVNPLRGQANVQGSCDMGGLPDFYPGYQKVNVEANRLKFENAWGVNLPSDAGLTVVEIVNGVEAGRIRSLYIVGENSLLSDPDVNHVRRCLEKVDFLVVQDVFLTETAQLADVVLPAAVSAEKNGTFTNSERRVQRVRPAVQPPGEARQDWITVGEIARRMGYAGLTYDNPQAIFNEMASLTPIYAGLSWERLEQRGIQWPCPSADHPGTPILHVGKFSRGLGLFSAVEWQPAAEEPDREYPFVFTTGRVLYHYHTGTLTRRSKGLNTLYPEPLAEINPEDAEKLGIRNGDRIRIASRRGEVIAKARVAPVTDQGVVFMAFHFAEAAANKLTNAALDPTAKIPEFKVCAVKVEPVP